MESLKAYCDSNSVAVAAVVTSPNASDPLAHSTATTTTTTAATATATASATATAVANYTATNSNVVQEKSCDSFIFFFYLRSGLCCAQLVFGINTSQVAAYIQYT